MGYSEALSNRIPQISLLGLVVGGYLGKLMECSDSRERCVERQAFGAVVIRADQNILGGTLGGSCSFFHGTQDLFYLAATQTWKENSVFSQAFGQEQEIFPMGATAGGLTFYL